MVGRNLLEHPGIASFEVFSPRSDELNLLNFDGTRNYLAEIRPDIVVHAAGRVGGIQANVREPVRFFVENLDMGKNVILAAQSLGIRKILNLGSSCMYPRNAPNPLCEDMILKGELEPTNEGYALAKIAVMRLCEYISREDPDFSYKTIIPCNIYGRFDKFDPLNSHLIPAIIDKVHQAKSNDIGKVEIWGDGNARREFMYAGDLADCMIRALHRFDDLPSTMNVGVGSDLTINEYYKEVANVIGYDRKFEHNLTKPVGMKQKLVSTMKSEQWGWKASTSLHEGIAKTYHYYIDQINKKSEQS